MMKFHNKIVIDFQMEFDYKYICCARDEVMDILDELCYV